MIEESRKVIEVSWVRCQVPRRVHYNVKAVSHVTGIPIAQLYTLILSRELHDISPVDYAAWLLRDLDGHDLPFRRLCNTPGTKISTHKKGGRHESGSC
jgi:hypothetical protein